MLWLKWWWYNYLLTSSSLKQLWCRIKKHPGNPKGYKHNDKTPDFLCSCCGDRIGPLWEVH
jgi:hypothetical protein